MAQLVRIGAGLRTHLRALTPAGRCRLVVLGASLTRGATTCRMRQPRATRAPPGRRFQARPHATGAGRGRSRFDRGTRAENVSMATASRLPEWLPEVGELVQVRSRRWLVEGVIDEGLVAPVVSLACADDDAQGEELEVLWRCELDRRILEDERSRASGIRSPTPSVAWALTAMREYVADGRWSAR